MAERRVVKVFDGSVWNSVCDKVVYAYDGSTWKQIKEGDEIYEDGKWFEIACSAVTYKINHTDSSGSPSSRYEDGDKVSAARSGTITISGIPSGKYIQLRVKLYCDATLTTSGAKASGQADLTNPVAASVSISPTSSSSKTKTVDLDVYSTTEIKYSINANAEFAESQAQAYIELTFIGNGTASGVGSLSGTRKYSVTAFNR